MKILIIIIGASLILGIITYVVSVFIKVYRKVMEASYENYIKEIRNILLRVEDEMLSYKTNPGQNLALLEIGDDNNKCLQDKILILFSARPKIDTDGEVFIIIGKFEQKDLDENNRRVNLISKSLPLFVSDSKDMFEYYRYTKRNYKRIRNIVLYINNFGNMSVNWATDSLENQRKCRDNIIELIKNKGEYNG